MNAVKQDWTWADKFLPIVRKIVGPHLLETASLEVDRTRATDLVLLRAKNLSIGCRIRRGSYHESYVGQFTIRSKRSSGVATEFDKIARGWCDMMFYGFADPTGKPELKAWNLIDLNAFRAHLILHPNVLRFGECSNEDGSGFRWYDIRSFPATPPILIESSQINPTRRNSSMGVEK